MLVLTTEHYDTSRFVAIGAVHAVHAEAVSVARDFAARIVGAFGSKSELITKKLQDASTAALAQLQANAIAAYPNAVMIVGMRLSPSQFQDSQDSSIIVFSAVGTVLVPVVGGARTRRLRRK